MMVSMVRYTLIHTHPLMWLDSNVHVMVECPRRPHLSRSRCVRTTIVLELNSCCAEPDVAAKAASYLRYLSVGIPGYGGNVVVRK